MSNASTARKLSVRTDSDANVKSSKAAPKRAAKRRKGLSTVQMVALATGLIGILGLLLSVIDCTASLSRLTGMTLPIACMLAIVIDAGMVAAEVSELAAAISRHARDSVVWARSYMGMAVAMSIVLNAVAFGEHSWVGYGIGAMIPIMLLCLFRLAGKLWLAGK